MTAKYLRDEESGPHLISEPKSETRLRVMPTTRGDCIGGPRPCPWSSCRYHLARPDVGARKVVPLAPQRASCALDVAAEGPHTLQQVGDHFGLTRERARQVEATALRKMRAGLEAMGISAAEVLAHLDGQWMVERDGSEEDAE